MEPDTKQPQTSPEAPDSAASAGAPVWQKVWDERYDAYYFFNAATNESTWTEPEGGVVEAFEEDLPG